MASIYLVASRQSIGFSCPAQSSARARLSAHPQNSITSIRSSGGSPADRASGNSQDYLGGDCNASVTWRCNDREA